MSFRNINAIEEVAVKVIVELAVEGFAKMLSTSP